jgi:hypothetical protein
MNALRDGGMPVVGGLQIRSVVPGNVFDFRLNIFLVENR